MIFLMASIAGLFVFTACEDGPQSGDRGTFYSIQAPAESEVYQLTGLPEGAYGGDVVSFGIVLTYPEDSVTETVEVYGATMKYKQLSAGEDGKYTFTMPQEPVTLTVKVNYYPDNTEDNFLAWDEENVYTFSIFTETEDDPYFDSFDDGILTANRIKDPSQSGGHFGVHEERAFSLDQAVIPDEALTVDVTERSMSNDAIAFVVHINRTMIREGTAKIVLVVENGHKFGDEAVLACTVRVTADSARAA